jgi:uncharacterized protein
MNTISSVTQSLNIRLGADTQFPISGQFQPVAGLNLLLQDIQQLLLTVPGERVFRPDFGCNLRAQIWENIDFAESAGAAAIREALERLEPRITVIDVNSQSNTNTGLITYNIQFLINQTDLQVNLVFPFRTGAALSFA